MRVGTQKFLATNYDAYGREINTGFVGSIPSNLGSIGFASTDDVMSELIYGTTTETDPIRKVNLLQTRFKTLTFDGNNDPVLGSNFFYDNYGRVSYTISNDGWLTSTYDERMDYTYDMRDNVLSQKYSQNVNSAPKTFKHTWEYDTWDRMISYYFNPTTSTDNGQHIARYDYDLRGRPTQRNLGKFGSSNWLQILNYTYNELDWLTAINPQGSSGLGTTQNMNEPLGIPTPGAPSAPSANPEDNDLFFLELKYHDPYANLDVPAVSRKSGDISQVWWRARGRNREGYGLTYDYLGRMTKAQHVRLADGSSPTTPGAKIINNYSEQLEYADQRGNIARILRYGMNYSSSTQSGSGVIDDLQFITDPGRNRILRINEQATDLVFKLKGFRPKTEANGSTSTGGIDYTYDANGNQTSDPHKGITSIQYNYLNLPSLITYTDGRKIEQRYDASGNVIFRWMTGDVATPANNYFQTYVYGTEYRGNTIESVAHQEGRLFRSGGSNSSPVWRYEYSISDHLGNTRLTFADKTPDGIIKVEDGEVLEEAHYYPFGLAMEGPWMNDAAALDNRYKFNGIERVQDFGLNVDMAMYRAYDPAIGRWWQADPIAKAWENPYAAMYNNPMNWSDFLGADPSKSDTLPTAEVTGKRTPPKSPLFIVDQSRSNNALQPQSQNSSNNAPVSDQTRSNWYQNSKTSETVSDFVNTNYVTVGTLDVIGANGANQLSQYVLRRGYSGANSNVYGNKLSQEQINSLRFRTPLGTVKGNNVARLSKVFRVAGTGAAAFGYVSVANSAMKGDITPERALVDMSVITYGWKGGLHGASLGFGYGVLGPLVVNNKRYQNWKKETWLPFRSKVLGY